MSFVFLAVGLYFSVRTGFFQITGLKTWMGQTFFRFIKQDDSVRKKDENSISQLQSLCTSLAAAIGTGNIAGVATAITVAGPGAVFWMVVSAMLGMMTGYAENYLGIVYRKRNHDGSYNGGAMQYIEHGLCMPKAAKLYAAVFALSALGMGNLVQINSAFTGAVKVVHSAFPKLSDYTGVSVTISAVLMLFIAIITFGGLKTLVGFTEKAVPIMAFLYLFACLAVIGININRLPGALLEIFTSAFTQKSVIGGGIGYSVSLAIRKGISIGTFSNEAGLGSSVTAHSEANCDNPQTQGMWSMFEIFVDTVVICMLTALVILCSGVYNSSDCLTAMAKGIEVESGVPLAATAFSGIFGIFGEAFISLIILLFAFSSVAAWTYYGTSAVSYIFGDKKIYIFLYKTIFVLIVPFGCFTHSGEVWYISEMLNMCMAIPNLAALLALSGRVKTGRKKNNGTKKSSSNS